MRADQLEPYRMERAPTLVRLLVVLLLVFPLHSAVSQPAANDTGEEPTGEPTLIDRLLGVFQRQQEDDDALPEDDRAAYKVAVIGSVPPEVPDELQLAIGALPELVRDEIRGYKNRMIPVWERTAMQERILMDAQVRAQSRYDARLIRLDRVFLTDGKPADRATDDSLQELQRNLRVLNALEPSRIEVPETKPVSVLEDDIEFYPFIDAPQALAKRLSADLVVVLYADKLGSRILVRLDGIFRATGERSEISRTVAMPEELSSAVAEMFPDLRRTVTGVSPGSLVVQAVGSDGNVLADTQILVAGEVRGTGQATVDQLAPGEYTVKLRNPAGVTVERTLWVLPGEQTTEVVEIETGGVDFVTVDTTPTGADVYRRAEWIGTTPLRVARPSEPTLYTLRRDGFLESRLTITPEVPSEISRRLVPDTVDFEASVEDARDRFYWSFGMFALSVALPVTLNGLYSDISGLFPGGQVDPALSDGEQETTYRRAQVLYIGYYGSLAVSGGFFANMVWKLSDYLRVGQGYHER